MPDAPIRVHDLEVCESTQDELRRLAAGGAPAFTAVRADVQRAGRGRRGRTWEAPAGTALRVSVLLRPAPPAAALPAPRRPGGIAAGGCAPALGGGAGPSGPAARACGNGK